MRRHPRAASIVYRADQSPRHTGEGRYPGQSWFPVFAGTTENLATGAMGIFAASQTSPAVSWYTSRLGNTSEVRNVAGAIRH